MVKAETSSIRWPFVVRLRFLWCQVWTKEKLDQEEFETFSCANYPQGWTLSELPLLCRRLVLKTEDPYARLEIKLIQKCKKNLSLLDYTLKMYNKILCLTLGKTLRQRRILEEEVEFVLFLEVVRFGTLLRWRLNCRSSVRRSTWSAGWWGCCKAQQRRASSALVILGKSADHNLTNELGPIQRVNWMALAAVARPLPANQPRVSDGRLLRIARAIKFIQPLELEMGLLAVNFSNPKKMPRNLVYYSKVT